MSNDQLHPDERTLVAAILAGDESAVAKLVRIHSGWMLAVAQRYVADHAIAQDCVQEALLNAIVNIGKFENRSKLKSWLHRIVINVALTKVRTNRRRNEVPIDELLPEFDRYGCRVEMLWPDIPAPDEILATEQMRDMVGACINRLPENYRIVLLLRDIEELNTREVALMLGLSEGAIKVRVHRARSALKKLLEPVFKGGM